MSREQKIPLSRALPAMLRGAGLDTISRLGLGIPGHVVSASGAIVTVNPDVTGLLLPRLTIPLAGPEYIRYPIQPGDLGVALSASFFLGVVSGLGSGPVDATRPGNLEALFWVPLGNKNWTAVDPDAVVIYGPNGVVLRDTESHTTATLTPAGLDIEAQNSVRVNSGDTIEVTADTSISLSAAGHSIVINSTGVIIDGKVFLTHDHTNVQPGSGVTGPVG